MIDAIDLDRPAVIEASAGTGKTYTIERLVLRLLVERNVPLENILLVTYTEKATGELKSRIRTMLERTLADAIAPLPVVQSSLDQFDQAPIFTIHGFCQRLLQEYSLEKGQDFRPELVNDGEWLARALEDVQRRVWPAAFGARLGRALEVANYRRDTAANWEKHALELAKHYRPECDHMLVPPYDPHWLQRWQPDQPPPEDARLQFFLHTVLAMKRHLEELKRQRGWQSFDDMITRVDQGLDAGNPRAPLLLRLLRERFRWAIVDEFQDTDPIQWRIFRRLFLEGGACKLVVVGDPKQAIYGFRGADLPTYLSAAREMQQSFGAGKYPLQTNWRSTPELIESLNVLFEDGKFFEGTGIQYVHVYAPDASQRQFEMTRDESARPALTVVDLEDSRSLDTARSEYAAFAVREIRHLLYGSGGNPRIHVRIKSEAPRPLRPSDICVLILRRSEADSLVRELIKARIPFSFYKQVGLWHSEEADQIGILLQALLHPEEPASFHRALLTRFFRVAPADLMRNREVPSRHPARRLFQSWAGMALERRWAALFQSILEHTGIPLEGHGLAHFDRRQANYRAVLETLEQRAYGENLDLLGLVQFWRDKQREGAESDYQPTDTDQPKVRIMTVHAAKGLEFPVVFFAGGFTRRRHEEELTTYRNVQGQLVFDLALTGQFKKAFKGNKTERERRAAGERESEARRLLYVAMTRAIFKLYVPFYTKGSPGWRGPLCKIVGPAVQRSRVVDLSGRAGTLLPEANRAAPKTPDAPTPMEPKPQPAPVQLGQLFLPIDEGLSSRRIVIRSFSSLHRQRSVREETSIFSDRPTRADETVSPHTERDDPLRGAVFGDLVHNVLEKLDWCEVGECAGVEALLETQGPARRVLDDEIRRALHKLPTRLPLDVLEKTCRRQVAELVWNALHTTLPTVGEPLCRIPPGDRLQELEFHFPEREEGQAERRREEGFFTGYIDLVFRKGQRYYLLDWKTNLLPAYGPDDLERAMEESDYHRQYLLYLQALARWLKRMHPRDFDFERNLGGVFYLFVRGMNGQPDSPGIFHRRPSAADIDLARILSP